MANEKIKILSIHCTTGCVFQRLTAQNVECIEICHFSLDKNLPHTYTFCIGGGKWLLVEEKCQVFPENIISLSTQRAGY